MSTLEKLLNARLWPLKVSIKTANIDEIHIKYKGETKAIPTIVSSVTTAIEQLEADTSDFSQHKLELIHIADQRTNRLVKLILDVLRNPDAEWFLEDDEWLEIHKGKVKPMNKDVDIYNLDNDDDEEFDEFEHSRRK